jgi:hypothetical protein
MPGIGSNTHERHRGSDCPLLTNQLPWLTNRILRENLKGGISYYNKEKGFS